jgi:putative transposase
MIQPDVGTIFGIQINNITQGATMSHGRRSIRLKGYDYTRPGSYFITMCAQGHRPFFGKIKNKKMELNLYGRIVYCKWIEIPRHFKNAQLGVFQIMPDHFHAIIILSDNTENPIVGAKHCRKDPGRSGANYFGPDPGRAGANYFGPDPGRLGRLGAKNSGQDPGRLGRLGAKHCGQESWCNTWNIASNASPQLNGTKSGSIAAIIQNFSSVSTRKINRIRKTPAGKIWQRGYYEHIIRDQDEFFAIQRYIIKNPANWRRR